MSAKIGGDAAFGGSALPTVAGMGGSEVTADINVTPMIDVMLVLLIIFMVTLPALAGYTATLPKAANVVPQTDEDRIELGIDSRGIYYVDGQAVSPEQLTEVLRRQYANRTEDHVLYLKADQGVSYSVVLTAIDAARNAGVTRIGAITEIPKGTAGNAGEGD